MSQGMRLPIIPTPTVAETINKPLILQSVGTIGRACKPVKGAGTLLQPPWPEYSRAWGYFAAQEGILTRA